MRHDLEPVQRPEPAQHLAAQDDQPAVLEHAHLAPDSVSFVGVGFSHACASGSYTARRPCCTIRYGSERSCPNRGSTST